MCVDAEQVGRRVLLGKFDVKEDDNAGDVVNDAFLLALPAEVALLDNSLGGLLCVLSIEEGLDDFSDLVVRDELPDTVTGNHDELVILAQVEFENFYIDRGVRPTRCHNNSNLNTYQPSYEDTYLVQQ